LTAFNKYYESERAFLNELGDEFARKNKVLAPFLGKLDDDPAANDPDVERLLEGFAFLTGRLREKLEDELPELTHSLIDLLWPHYLRPIPSMSILQFQALNELDTHVKQDCAVDSEPINGTKCHFKTCYDVDIYPLELEQITLAPSKTALTIHFLFKEGADFSNIDLKTLRLFLDGPNAYTLYLWLFRHLKDIQIGHIDDNETEPTEPAHDTQLVSPVGFVEEDKLLPYPTNAFAGYRLLQEYFSLPEKFLFVDINGLNPINTMSNTAGFKLIFNFRDPLETTVAFKKEHIRLHCTPIVNLFEHDAVPIALNHQQVEYLIRPEGNLEQYEIYSVDSVQGRDSNSTKWQNYPKFEDFHHAEEGQAQTYYRTKLLSSVVRENSIDTYIAFVTPKKDNVLPTTETVSLDLICTNRQLLHEPNNKPGIICKPTQDSPDSMKFENITSIKPSVPPPLKGGLHWRMISNMSLNYKSLSDVDALREIVLSYDFAAHINERKTEERRSFLECIKRIQSSTLNVLVKGSPIRGIKTHIDMVESQFPKGDGEMYLFCCILNEFFALYASINSFHQLEVRGVERGETYRWPPMQGKQYLNGVEISEEQSSRHI
jgi:type VI secretion system protein ImpG